MATRILVTGGTGTLGREVVRRLVQTGPPVRVLSRRPAPPGRAPDLGGPQVRTFRDLASAYLRATGRRRLVFPLRLPGSTFRGYRHGGHLTPAHADGRRTFEEYLAARYG